MSGGTGGPDWDGATTFTPDGSPTALTPIGDAGSVGSVRPFNAVWWKFTAPVDGRLVFDTFASTGPGSPDTSVIVYEGGTDEASGTSVGDIDDENPATSPPPGAESLASGTVEVVAGQTYRFKVGTWWDNAFLPDDYALTGTLYVTGDPTWLTQTGVTGDVGFSYLDAPIGTVEVNDFLSVGATASRMNWLSSNGLGPYSTEQELWDAACGRGVAPPATRGPATFGGSPLPSEYHVIYGWSNLSISDEEQVQADNLWYATHYFISNGPFDVPVEFENPDGAATVSATYSVDVTQGPEAVTTTSTLNDTNNHPLGPIRLLVDPASVNADTYPAAESAQPSGNSVTIDDATMTADSAAGPNLFPVAESFFSSSQPDHANTFNLYVANQAVLTISFEVTRSRYRPLVPYLFGIPERRLYPRPVTRVYPPPPFVQTSGRTGSAAIL